MVHFVGAGSGAVDLITLRGARLLENADVVIYAGSLVNPQLLEMTRPGCRIHNSAEMTLEQVIDVIRDAEAQDLDHRTAAHRRFQYLRRRAGAVRPTGRTGDRI